MKDIDLTPKLIQLFGTKTRKVGRYSVSDLYAIKKGWTKPEDYHMVRENDFEGIKKMWAGVMNHNFIESLLDPAKCEQKVVYKYRDIEIVGKADYLPDENEVIDFKTSDHVLDGMKPWNEHQIKMYCTMFKRARGSIYQPVLEGDRYILKFKGGVVRDDAWFEQECEELYKFHERILSIKSLYDRD